MALIESAAEILAELGEEPDEDEPAVPLTALGRPRKVWRYPKTRRSPRSAPEPCKNAYRGCVGMVNGKRCGHGFCPNCYSRWKKWGDSWHHSRNVLRCTKKNCFMRAQHDQIRTADPG